LYPKGAGYFFLQAGSVVDARIGALQGIDAVYYALTLPNAEFEFSVDAEATNRSINQPWTQVVLEGLRRLDENIPPSVAFPPDFVAEPDGLVAETPLEAQNGAEGKNSLGPAFFSFAGSDSGNRRKPLFIGAMVVAVLASVAVIGVPAGWYKSNKTPAASTEVVTQTPVPESAQAETPAQSQPVNTEAQPTVEDAASVAAKRQREKERKLREAAARAADSPAPVAVAPPSDSVKPGAKRVVVTVIYDESGRVTQASGGDANALRIARQKRFPPGKAGSATVAIPIN
jgi:hypothetical protein